MPRQPSNQTAYKHPRLDRNPAGRVAALLKHGHLLTQLEWALVKGAKQPFLMLVHASHDIVSDHLKNSGAWEGDHLEVRPFRHPFPS